MSTMFEELMKGLDEVEAYLAGEREGYKVPVPGTSVDEPATAKTKYANDSASLCSASG